MNCGMSARRPSQSPHWGKSRRSLFSLGKFSPKESIMNERKPLPPSLATAFLGADPHRRLRQRYRDDELAVQYEPGSVQRHLRQRSDRQSELRIVRHDLWHRHHLFERIVRVPARSGFLRQCVASNAMHCGTSCTACTGTQVCAGNSCSASCATGSMKCSDGACSATTTPPTAAAIVPFAPPEAPATTASAAVRATRCCAVMLPDVTTTAHCDVHHGVHRGAKLHQRPVRRRRLTRWQHQQPAA